MQKGLATAMACYMVAVCVHGLLSQRWRGCYAKWLCLPCHATAMACKHRHDLIMCTCSSRSGCCVDHLHVWALHPAAKEASRLWSSSQPACIPLTTSEGTFHWRATQTVKLLLRRWACTLTKRPSRCSSSHLQRTSASCSCPAACSRRSLRPGG